MFALASAGVLGGAFAWFAVSGYGARTELFQARTEATALRAQVAAGQLEQARASAVRLGANLREARERTSGPLWDLAAALPRLDGTVVSIRGLSETLEQVATETLPDLLDVAAQVEAAARRDASGGIDLRAIAATAPTLQSSATALNQAVEAIAALPERTVLGAVDAARADVLGELTRAAERLRTANVTANLLPAMLGAQGRRTYLLAYQNNAEARGTGGLAGAFGLLEVDRGRISIGAPDTQRMLSGATAESVVFEPEYERFYAGAASKTLYSNANLSSHFPYAAQIWRVMWAQRFPEKIDGVIALDPAVLGYLLTAAGPVALADGTVATGQNVASLTQQQAYSRFPKVSDDAARRLWLAQLQAAVTQRIMAPDVDPRGLLVAATRAASERRLLVWSAHPAEQRTLERYVVGGTVPVTTAPYVGLSIVNEAGNKLDYYLDRSVLWQRTGCGPRREVTVTVKVRNDVPPGVVSEVVTARHDEHDYPVQPGDNRIRVGYLATSGAVLRSVTLDGKPYPATLGSERGHPLASIDVELPQRRTRTLVLKFVEPDGDGAAPVVLRQPLVRPLQVRLLDVPCTAQEGR
ncbi:MAG: DUF4012 domain-containing protein [Sporichthyaceae bacterium]